MANDGPSEKAKALIDENLRRVFHQIADEPLPERLQDVLKRLRESAPNSAQDSS